MIGKLPSHTQVQTTARYAPCPQCREELRFLADLDLAEAQLAADPHQRNQAAMQEPSTRPPGQPALNEGALGCWPSENRVSLLTCCVSLGRYECEATPV